jgi:hypothetical protein
MNEDLIFKELEKLLNRLSVEVKYRKGHFKSGLCRYRGKKYFYLNRTDSKEIHLAIMLSEIEKMNLEGIELPQVVEEHLLKSEA